MWKGERKHILAESTGRFHPTKDKKVGLAMQLYGVAYREVIGAFCQIYNNDT